ncbi:hypothetical protein M758_1G108600 [Ceratodon purpureus]|nr:hypothetical protein M758_1G108600 [Ceratodon purpureus]
MKRRPAWWCLSWLAPVNISRAEINSFFSKLKIAPSNLIIWGRRMSFEYTEELIVSASKCRWRLLHQPHVKY